MSAVSLPLPLAQSQVTHSQAGDASRLGCARNAFKEVAVAECITV